MRLRLGYLTLKQRLIWKLKNEGLTEASIGRKLKIRRQIIHREHIVNNGKFFTFTDSVRIGILVD